MKLKSFLWTLLSALWVVAALGFGSGCATADGGSGGPGPADGLPTTLNGLYVRTFGNPSNQSLIFIHGGPGFNSSDFETTTAQPLADLGYYVVVYDQRGQGRSDPAMNPRAYTYRKYAADLESLIKGLNLKSPILVGHSHGGIIAILFDHYYPTAAKAVILVSTPVDYWTSMQDLEKNCSARYEAQGQKKQLEDLKKNFEEISQVKPFDGASVVALSQIYAHALAGCHLYATAHPTDEEKNLELAAYKDAPVNEYRSMPGFLLNENYIRGNYLEDVKKRPGHFFGIYGDEDGLFTEQSRVPIKDALGSRRFFLVSGASHAVYLGQQKEFLRLVNRIADEAR